MGIISWIILGLIAGFIGSKIVDKQGQGFWLNIALGIIGALVGGILFSAFGATGVTGLNIWSMIVAIVGSIVVLLFAGGRGGIGIGTIIVLGLIGWALGIDPRILIGGAETISRNS